MSEPGTNAGCHFCVQTLNENVADRKGSNKMLENDFKKRRVGGLRREDGEYSMSRKTYKSNQDAKIACHVNPGQPPTHSQNRPTAPKNVNARWKSERVCTRARACMRRCMYQRSHAHQKPNDSIAQTTGLSVETPHSRHSASSSASSTRKDVEASSACT